MILIKKGVSSLSTLKPLYALHDRCQKVDGYSTKFYWYLLHKRINDKDDQFDYLAYFNNQLVGTLHLYSFAQGTEMSALVDPLYRRKGIFRKLFMAAYKNLKDKNISNCILIINNCNQFIVNLFGHNLIDLKYRIHEYQAPSIVPIINAEPRVSIHQAELDNIDILVEVNRLCFKQNFNEKLRQKFLDDLNDDTRQIYIVKNTNNQIIGKFHLRFEKLHIVIHEVGVLPAYQNQGYGKNMILKWLNDNAQIYNDRPIIVEMIDSNKVGVALYQSCGFNLSNIFNYYSINLDKLIKIKIH